MPSIITKLTLFLITVLSCACGGNQAVQPMHPAIVQITQHENPTQFIGEGRLSHPADFIEFTVTIQSECYPTAFAASQASDRSSKKVVAALREFVDAGQSKDGVFFKGGFSAPFSRYVNSQLSVCQNTFQKTASVTLKTSKIEKFSKGFDEIQKIVFESGTASPPQQSRSEKGLTYVSIKTPETQLYYETRERLEQQALADALDNARKKFESTAKMACGVSGYKILRFVESSPSAGRPIAYGRSQPSSTGGSLAFDAIWVNKLLTVSFDAESKTCR
ncbi:MAG: SIMPL domain-containing protein [Kofleriaceae bacterium]|nr:SIMPL domain-containing protein [Kofleriaceae bacterium]